MAGNIQTGKAKTKEPVSNGGQGIKGPTGFRQKVLIQVVLFIQLFQSVIQKVRLNTKPFCRGRLQSISKLFLGGIHIIEVHTLQCNSGLLKEAVDEGSPVSIQPVISLFLRYNADKFGSVILEIVNDSLKQMALILHEVPEQAGSWYTEVLKGPFHVHQSILKVPYIVEISQGTDSILGIINREANLLEIFVDALKLCKTVA